MTNEKSVVSKGSGKDGGEKFVLNGVILAEASSWCLEQLLRITQAPSIKSRAHLLCDSLEDDCGLFLTVLIMAALEPKPLKSFKGGCFEQP